MTKQIIRYVVIMVLQVLLVDQLQLLGVCHPFIYVMCLLLMPITSHRNTEMVIGALAGLVMDVFSNSLGVHIGACIFVMFLRPYVLGMLVTDIDRLNEQVSLRSLGAGALIKYTVILVLIHHLAVFMLAAWSWSHFGYVLLETIVSGLLTILFVIGYNLLINR
ncbi:MAG: hypothetical protein K6A36_04625 [Paludibacteraceae bacterium]|nr:hypothetical protein [Paludibacteraceae bacterium]